MKAMKATIHLSGRQVGREYRPPSQHEQILLGHPDVRVASRDAHQDTDWWAQVEFEIPHPEEGMEVELHSGFGTTIERTLTTIVGKHPDGTILRAFTGRKNYWTGTPV